MISQNVSPETTIPISDFTEAKDQILEVERLTTRVHAITQAIRPNYGYDASIGEKVEELMTGDLKGVPIKGLNTGERVSDKLDFLPLDQFIKALQVVVQARREALNGLYETLKASDIMRGASDPMEQRRRSSFATIGAHSASWFDKIPLSISSPRASRSSDS